MHAHTHTHPHTRTHTHSKLQREASGINTSLMKLWRCLDQLRRNQQAAAATTATTNSSSSSELLVPFRESKITHLFMNHLSGAAVGRTVMLLNVNPSKVAHPIPSRPLI